MKQGDLFWIDLGPPFGSEPGYRRPCVVVQNDAVNGTRINTAIICLLTSNLKRAEVGANVLLLPGEGDLPQQSVVNGTQLFTVDRRRLEEKIGTLSRQRIRQIVERIARVLEPSDFEEAPED